MKNKCNEVFNKLSLKGQVVVVAGRPSSGKTKFASQIIKNHYVPDNKNVYYCSIEQISENLKESYFQNFESNDNNLYINDDYNCKFQHIESFILSKKIDLVVVDYIQLMKKLDKNYDQYIVTAKELAIKYGVSFLILSQLNRDHELHWINKDNPSIDKIFTITTERDMSNKIEKIDSWYRSTSSQYELDIPEKISLLPFIEDKYINSTAVRIMHVGVNAYIGESDWGNTKEERWRDWARNDEHRFHKWMTQNSSAFNFETCSYKTNLIKIYLSSKLGKTVKDIPEDVFKLSENLFREEIKLLNDLKLLPHIILCYGLAAWNGVWPMMFESFKAEDIRKHRAFSTQVGDDKLLVFRITHHSHYNQQSKENQINANKIMEEYKDEIKNLIEVLK